MALKDAIKRRTHKERSQPAVRRKFGLLEKKKDYLLRAKDYHKKEAAINTLRRKAEERNPDEFYFAMEKTRTKGGIHVVPTGEANKYTQEQLRLMKTQDVGYLSMKSQAEKKKVEKMQESLHLIGAPVQERRHVVFVEDGAEVKKFDPETYFDTPADLLERSYNRPRKAQLAEGPLVLGSRTASGAVTAKSAEKRKAAAYRELLQRQSRQGALSGASQRLEYQKQVMGNGRKRKLAPEEANGQSGIFRWKTERKR